MKIITLVVLLITTIYANTIKDYKVIKKIATIDNKEYIAIREFVLDDKKSYLVVDKETLQTEIVSASSIDVSKYKRDKSSIIEKVYIKSKENKKHIHNAGINRAYKQKKNIQYLTIDMCPSSKNSYERELFKVLNKKPISIAVALSARWAMKHKKEFAEIKSMKNLSITWINHSYYHYYYPKKPLEKNFMLANGTDVYKEIVANEKYMISHGITPSIFFRFPGLVSNAKLIDKIVDNYSLVPLGSDTWIAKGEKIKDSSIILVHGNLNEKKGIDMLLNEMRKREFNFVEINEMFIPIY
jgi:peptidoglycan/xylan/chitin deacetylase (PgdA/CDA1 family)